MGLRNVITELHKRWGTSWYILLSENQALHGLLYFVMTNMQEIIGNSKHSLPYHWYCSMPQYHSLREQRQTHMLMDRK